MQLKTILNRVERYKSFVYGEPRWKDDSLRLTIEVPTEPRAIGVDEIQPGRSCFCLTSSITRAQSVLPWHVRPRPDRLG